MLIKTRALLLHTLRYGETSLIAQTYTGYTGRHSFIFKGIRGRKTGIRHNVLQPLTFLDIEANIRQGYELSYVKEASVFRAMERSYLDVRKSAQVLFLAELLYHCLREEESNPVLFRFLDHSLEYFDQLDVGSADFHLVFLVRLTKYLGFLPGMKNGDTNQVFNPFEGLFAPSEEGKRSAMSIGNSELLNRMLVGTYDELTRLELNQAKRNLMLDDLLKFYSIHIDGISRIKSHLVLRELF